MDITIRRETPADYDAVYDLVREAFASAEHADGDEQNLVVRLRGSESFVPQLSLVAEYGGSLVGHILFTKAQVADATVLVLAPLAVLPDYQRSGIGGRLMEAGHRVARALGYEVAVVVGHPTYYPRFGYVPAAQYGIETTMELPPDVFMARNLLGRNTQLNGVIRFAPEFGIG